MKPFDPDASDWKCPPGLRIAQQFHSVQCLARVARLFQVFLAKCSRRACVCVSTGTNQNRARFLITASLDGDWSPHNWKTWILLDIASSRMNPYIKPSRLFHSNAKPCTRTILSLLSTGRVRTWRSRILFFFPPASKPGAELRGDTVTREESVCEGYLGKRERERERVEERRWPWVKSPYPQ